MTFVSRLAFVLVAFTLASAAIADPAIDGLTLENTVYATAEEAFIPHEGDGPYGSYLAMSIPFTPVKALFGQVQAAAGQTLISRGEAHITVVTPVEFDQRLKAHLSIAEVTQIAKDAEIQSTAFSVVCLGRGKLSTADADQFTYFLVVDADGLLAIRRRIHAAFVAAGGDPATWDPELFYPHVTIGFTVRDLHLEDGVVKDRSSCVGSLVTPG